MAAWAGCPAGAWAGTARRWTFRPRDKGKSIFLDVDGAMSYAAVWLNGRLVGGWPYGYNSWRLDLTPYVVRSAASTSWRSVWTTRRSRRAGIPAAVSIANVWLTKTAPVHVGQWGVFVRTPEVSARAAKIELDVAGRQ
jgi:beta-galactosidase